MLRSGSPSEHTITNQALAHVLTDDKEYLADLIGAVGACPMAFVVVVRNHIE
ncbi:MAG: hypothetical protein WA239_22135 [Candidatus Sulfotelmatobacter sp.]|jgi:hypothetical protein